MKRMIHLIGSLGALAVLSGCGIGTHASVIQKPVSMGRVLVNRGFTTATVSLPVSWMTGPMLTTDGQVAPPLYQFGNTSGGGATIMGTVPAHPPLPAKQTQIFTEHHVKMYQVSLNGSVLTLSVTVPDTAPNRILAQRIIQSWHVHTLKISNKKG